VLPLDGIFKCNEITFLKIICYIPGVSVVCLTKQFLQIDRKSSDHYERLSCLSHCVGLLPWNNIVKLLKDYDAADTELLIYAVTLVNKTLNGIPDQDTYYDQVDSLEEQGIEGTIQR